MKRSFPLISISGSPSQRGESYGRQAAAQIALAIDIYRGEFQRRGMYWPEALRLAGEFLGTLRDYDPILSEEMEAIAHGADRSVQEIVLLNARTEVMFWKEKKARTVDIEQMIEECTSAVALPEATQDGHLLHGQNWDWNPACVDLAVVLEIRQDDAPDILTFVEAGQLARHGLNSEGIALTAMGLHSDRDYGRMGIPNPMIRRKMLGCRNLGEAMSVLTNSPRSFSHCLILSHADGEAFSFETTPDEVYWLEPEDGILVHANHFKSTVAMAQLKDLNLGRSPDSLYRDSRVRRALKAAEGSISMETFRQVFSDEFGKPNSVLRHPAPRPGGMISATLATLIMDTTERIMWLAPTPFKNAHFTEYRLG